MSNMTTREIWDKATASIYPIKPTRPGYAHCLHPKMINALGKLRWDEVATRETEERATALKAWCEEQGIEY